MEPQRVPARPAGQRHDRHQKYFNYAIEYDYPFNIVKFCLQQLLGSLHDSELGRNFLNNATIRDLCLVFRYSELFEARLLQLTGKVRPDQRFGEKVDKVG